ncbi:hypothetical protein SRABI128_06329 [Microbacterium sp. Bi128]|nr:hypothetical protein SRABI128_06329 [Microbacterium sp. Bi128]
MTAKTPVMVRIVVSNGAQVERWRRWAVSTMGCRERFSTVQNPKKAITATAMRAVASARVPGENPLTSLEASLRAVSRAPTAITMKKTPGQSILVPTAGLLSPARTATRPAATTASTTMSQKMLRNP